MNLILAGVVFSLKPGEPLHYLDMVGEYKEHFNAMSMKNLFLNPENVSEEEVATYDVRHAARAVVTDADGLIALLHVGNVRQKKGQVHFS